MGYRLRVWDERTLQRLAAAWRDGVTPRELAERFGYTERAISGNSPSCGSGKIAAHYAFVTLA